MSNEIAQEKKEKRVGGFILMIAGFAIMAYYSCTAEQQFKDLDNETNVQLQQLQQGAEKVFDDLDKATPVRMANGKNSTMEAEEVDNDSAPVHRMIESNDPPEFKGFEK